MRGEMGDIIYLSRVREGRARPPEEPSSEIVIAMLADGTHCYHITGHYARSPTLATRTLAQVIEKINDG